jgi:hypothetical protein
MGWYEAPRYPGAMVGDQAYDTTHEFLRCLSRLYEHTFDRRPTLRELMVLIEVELRVTGGELLSDLEERRVTRVDAKTEPKRKDQPFALGDVFAVPINEQQFAFGRIMMISKARGMLIEIFKEGSPRLRYQPSVVESGRLFHPVLTTGDPLKNWEWTVVTSDQGYQMSDADRAIEFASPGPVNGWCAVDLNAKIVRRIDEAEASRMERGWAWNAAQIEERIRSAFASATQPE